LGVAGLKQRAEPYHAIKEGGPTLSAKVAPVVRELAEPMHFTLEVIE
jgi:hypothetical protein